MDYIKIGIIAASCIIGLASTLVLKLKKDNPIEQMAEKILHQETGINIDFTPEEKEDL